MFMMNNKSFNGAYDKDPYHFNHQNIEFISAYMDGFAHLSVPYQPDFDNDDFTREYLALF